MHLVEAAREAFVDPREVVGVCKDGLGGGINIFLRSGAQVYVVDAAATVENVVRRLRASLEQRREY